LIGTFDNAGLASRRCSENACEKNDWDNYRTRNKQFHKPIDPHLTSPRQGEAILSP